MDTEGAGGHEVRRAEGLDDASNRARRAIERHYRVWDDHLKDRTCMTGNAYTIADISAWAGSTAPRAHPRV